MARFTGTYDRKIVGGEEIAAFLPHALPPADPPLELDARARELLRAAEHALSRLELAGEMVPSVEWFICAFVRKEAVVSSGRRRGRTFSYAKYLDHLRVGTELE